MQVCHCVQIKMNCLGRSQALVDDACVPSTSSRCAGAHPVVRWRTASKRSVTAHGLHEQFSLFREPPPLPRDYVPGVIPGVRTVATPLLSQTKIIDRLHNAVHENAADNFGAFYSSELGGIVTDPAFMVIHMDDHMVHRGHGVFDTALITDGHLYQLPEHVERLVASAGAAGLDLPFSETALMRIILDTAAASRKINGMVKYWVTAGRGGFGLSDSECIEPGFYALATSEHHEIDRLNGWTATTSPISPKPSPFATIKSNNYLQNALAKIEAEQRGFDVGIFVDEKGYILEGPNMNIGIITQDDVLVTPPFNNCLAGITIQRLMQLIPEEKKRSPNDVVISDIQQRPIHVEEVLQAKEAFLAGSSIRVVSIVSWDNKDIGDGTPGISALAFNAMLELDMQPREDSDVHMEIPYGYAFGMRDQLM